MHVYHIYTHITIFQYWVLLYLLCPQNVHTHALASRENCHIVESCSTCHNLHSWQGDGCSNSLSNNKQINYYDMNASNNMIQLIQDTHHFVTESWKCIGLKILCTNMESIVLQNALNHLFSISRPMSVYSSYFIEKSKLILQLEYFIECLWR